MAPTNKAKVAGVSASSFLDLKAELAKQESEFKKKGSRSTGGEKVSTSGNQCVFLQPPTKLSHVLIFRKVEELYGLGQIRVLQLEMLETLRPSQQIERRQRALE